MNAEGEWAMQADIVMSPTQMPEKEWGGGLRIIVLAGKLKSLAESRV